MSERETASAKQRSRDARAHIASSMLKLRRGDVISVPRGRWAGMAVVLDVGAPSEVEPRVMVLTAQRQYRRLGEADFTGPVTPAAQVRVPKSFNPRNAASRRDLASTLRAQGLLEQRPGRRRDPAAEDPEVARLRSEIRAHPCHQCPEREEHARTAARHRRAVVDTDRLRAQVDARTATVARTFDRVCAVLDDLGYLTGDQVSTDGRALARIYGELDLLTAECLRRGLWTGLGPAELAACASVLVYETRSKEPAGPPQLPEGRVREVLAETIRVWAELERREKNHRLSFLREPDLGFVRVTHRWAQGKPLEQVLREADMPAGDFVRWCKQLIDCLGQIAAVSAPELRPTAEAAITAVRRGVVAWSSLN